MKKIIPLILSAILFLNFSFAYADSKGDWKKYITSDKSYSFYYPSGWKAFADDSVIGAENKKTLEQFFKVGIPDKKGASSQELAKDFIKELKKENPYIKASNFVYDEGEIDNNVVFDLSNKINGKRYLGIGLVVKSKEGPIWISYFSPAKEYYKIRALNILRGFMASLSEGTKAKEPKITYNTNVAKQIDKNSKDFLFVLEFALGAPFTLEQQNVILNELKESWRHLSESELKSYNMYRNFKKLILSLGQKELEELRLELEKEIKLWLKEYKVPTKTSSGSKTNKKFKLDMTSHASMMAIKEMTFNSYMKSRGYNYHLVYGRM